MVIRVAAQMDHLQDINLITDSTIIILKEAYKRNFQIFYYHPDKLSCNNNRVTAQIHKIDFINNQPILGNSYTEDIATMDIVLLRQNPPFNMNYITTTHILEKLPKTTLVVNNPKYVRNLPEKLFIMNFPEFMPDTLISRDIYEINKFRELHDDIIMKPLFEYGGKKVFKIAKHDPNFQSLFEFFSETFEEAWINQAFISNVTEGDKRVILIDGQIAGAINRIPPKNEFRSNLVVGGKANLTSLNDKEKEVCHKIGAYLKEKDLIFVGLDIIDNQVTEINTTSPTGIASIIKFSGKDNITPFLWDTLENKIAKIKKL